MVHHAARDRNQGFGMAAPDLSNGLTAFLVARVGDGAGVNDVNVGVLAAQCDVVAIALELRGYRVGLVEVKAAA